MTSRRSVVRRTIVIALGAALLSVMVLDRAVGSTGRANQSLSASVPYGGWSPETARPSAAVKCRKGSDAAVIGGRRVCLRLGMSCSRRYQAQYVRRGYQCNARGRLVRLECKGKAVHAVIGGVHGCLRAGDPCRVRLAAEYRRYEFECDRGRLVSTEPLDVQIALSGATEVVFDWTNDRCEDSDIPDLPARVFRDGEGNVQLISSHFVSRRFVGPDLNRLTHGCEVVMGSSFNPDPAAFDDHEWIASTWSPDGTTIYALIHNEYQGNTHPGRCPSGEYFKCWYNAVTLAVSRDGGRTFLDAATPKLVATIPHQYAADAGPAGMFTPSNIVRNSRDGYFYALVYRNIRNLTIGNCLIRTRDLSDARSWRAWTGGKSFGTTFVDPYGPNPDPEQHLCRALPIGHPGDLQPQSLTWNTVARQWLLVGQALEGAYYALSPDLVTWTEPRLFWEAQVTWDYACGDPDPIAYTTLIDPDSTSRNFETSGDTAYVYYTQLHYQNCQQTLDRDLLRVPVQIKRS